MDKVELYLDQVCRGIAGPRALRQHIRQELAEHLRDAAAVHQAAGMSEDDALARALEDFGGPEQVRAELEATHGHRLLTVVVDKAMQWKETTMKAKWVWNTWAHVMLVLTIAVELAFIYGCMIFIAPKFREMAHVGWIDPTAPNEIGPVNRWALSVIDNMIWACGNGLWVALLAAAGWALFEWRVRSENKTLMRLAKLGTVAAALGVAASLTGAALILPSILAADPGIRYHAVHQIAATHTVKLDESMLSLDAAIAAKDWGKMRSNLDQVSRELRELKYTGLGQSLWESPDEPNGIFAQFRAVEKALEDARAACGLQNTASFDTAMKAFRDAYGRLRPSSTATEPKKA